MRSVTPYELESMGFNALKKFASSCGIGYHRLDRDDLLEKILLEGREDNHGPKN